MTDRNLPDTTKLALERTRLAYERTLMAWVRTATSLISFGFTIYKFFQYLRESQQIPPDTGKVLGARGFALLMIGTGLAALTAATIEHRRNVQALKSRYHDLVPASLATVIAGFVAMLGIVGLLAVMFRQ